MKIKLTRTIDLNRLALDDWMSDLGYDDEIAEEGDAFIRKFVQDWIWFNGSIGLERDVLRYQKMHERAGVTA
jgi:hypothetical protein